MWWIILIVVAIVITAFVFIVKATHGKTQKNKNTEENGDSNRCPDEEVDENNFTPYIICPKCGFPVYNDEIICSNCNAKIRTEKERDLLVEGGKPVPIKKTVIISQDNRRDSDDVIGKAILGGILFGGAGAIVGGSLGREIRTTTFLLVFEDGTKEKREVENNSELYDRYIQYLDI